MVKAINQLTPNGISQTVQGNDGAYLFTIYPGIRAGMNVTTDQHIGYLSFQGITLLGINSPCHGILQSVNPGPVKNTSVLAKYTATPAAVVA